MRMAGPVPRYFGTLRKPCIPTQAAENNPARRTLDLGSNIPLDAPNSPRLMYRPRCASVVIASSGADIPVTHHTRFGEIRSRSGTCLKFTRRDAESVYALWRKEESDLPDELQVLLIDPTIREVEHTLRQISRRILDAYPDDIGLDFFLAGHGEEDTGNLVLKGGTLSPTRFLELQADDVDSCNCGPRTIGVFLDSCHSGAFLLRLAIESFEEFEGFRLDEGLASCLPDESSWEMPVLEHGVYTFTRLHRGNSYVDIERFNLAILNDDKSEIAKGLQGLVGMISNSSAFLTQGQQFSMSLTKHVIKVDGGFAEVELGEKTDFVEAIRQLTSFKTARS